MDKPYRKANNSHILKANFKTSQLDKLEEKAKKMPMSSLPMRSHSPTGI